MVGLFVNDVESGQMFSLQVGILLQLVAIMECKPTLRIQRVVLLSIHTGKAIIHQTNSIIITVSDSFAINLATYLFSSSFWLQPTVSVWRWSGHTIRWIRNKQWLSLYWSTKLQWILSKPGWECLVSTCCQYPWTNGFGYIQSSNR